MLSAIRVTNSTVRKLGGGVEAWVGLGLGFALLMAGKQSKMGCIMVFRKPPAQPSHFTAEHRGRRALAVVGLVVVAMTAADHTALGADTQAAEWCTLGPYVEFTGARSAVVRWETAEPTSSIVQWGTTRELGRQVEDATPERVHEVAIDQLKWKARHYFRVGAHVDEVPSYTPLKWFDNANNYSVPSVADAVLPLAETPAEARRWQQTASYILDSTDIRRGYALVYGIESGRLALELARQSHLNIICIDEDRERLDRAGDLLMDAGVYGVRVTVRHVEDFAKTPFSDQFFNLATSERVLADGRLPGLPAEVHRVLRPCGGTFLVPLPPAGAGDPVAGQTDPWSPSAQHAPQRESVGDATWLRITREPKTDARWWTHQYGGPHNAGNNFDTLGGARGTDDLELQWIGRPGLDAGLDRQVRMPAPVSANGRIYHQGFNRIMAIDSYNGAMLWSLEIPQLRRVNLPRDASNMCADEEGVFLAVKDACWRLDGPTGRRTRSYHLDEPGMDWGVVFRYGDLLYGSSVPAGSSYTKYWGPDYWYEGHPTLVWGGTHEAAANQVLSDNLFALDPATGQRAWTYRGGMILNTSVALNNTSVAHNGGMVLFVESRTPEIQHRPSGEKATVEQAQRVWDDIHLVALDAASGHKLWERSLSQGDERWPAVSGGVAAFYLLTAELDGELYAAIQSSYPIGPDDPEFTQDGENNGWMSMYGYRIGRGGAEHLWSDRQRWAFVVKKKLRRAAVVRDRIVLAGQSYQIRDGVSQESGIPEFGCGTLTAIGDVLIGRFDDLGGQDTYYDITLWDTRTQKLSSWTPLRPSCWLSTISGGGMLLAPEAGGGCSCQVYFGASVGFAPRGGQSVVVNETESTK